MVQRYDRSCAVALCGLLLFAAVACENESRQAGPLDKARTGSAEPGPPGVAASSETAARERAERAADALAGALVTRLTDGISNEGTVGALDICAEVAQELTRQASEEHGVIVRRTSLRVRNPANRPDAYERAWLERSDQRIADFGERPGPTAEMVDRAGAGRELRYVRPLYLADLCVQCHGAPARLAAGVPEALATLYPEDAATGFAPGDLRGVISVRVPLAE